LFRLWFEKWEPRRVGRRAAATRTVAIGDDRHAANPWHLRV